MGVCSQGKVKKRRQSLCSSPGPSLPRRSLPRRRGGFLFAQKAAATRRLGGQTWPLLHMQKKKGSMWEVVTDRVQLQSLNLLKAGFAFTNGFCCPQGADVGGARKSQLPAAASV